jgi:hypothetical protein
MNSIVQLISGPEADALDALETARETGNIQWVRPMLEAFRDRTEERLRQEIGSMLGALKVSEGAEVMGDALEDPEFAKVHADIIGFLWSCGFQSENHLRSVVHCAGEGDFRCAMEALTWIEELESVNDENALWDVLLLIRGIIEEGREDGTHPLFEAMHKALSALEKQQ